MRKDDEDLPLSSYLRRFRTYDRVAIEDVASLLGVPVDLLNQLESNDSMPWNLSPSLVADVACLFRLHVIAVESLTKNSLDIAYFSGRMPNRDSAAALMSTWLSEVRGELQRRGAKDLLD